MDYKVICKLWIHINDKVRIFCKLEQDINDNINIKLNSATFTLNNFRIYIISEMKYSINLIHANTSIPCIYSNSQSINVESIKDTYEIKLRYLEYNNEQLILSKKKEESYFILLEECIYEKNEIICTINRNKIEKIFGYTGEIFELNYLDKNIGKLICFENVFDIIINYSSIQKENIYIGINNILTNNLENNSYIAYEINISSIHNLISNKFTLSTNDSNEIPCLLKKEENQSLLLLCKISDTGIFTLAEITKELNLDNINIKYNLIIQPILNRDIFTVSGNSGLILITIPMILDFYIDNSFIIYFY